MATFKRRFNIMVKEYESARSAFTNANELYQFMSDNPILTFFIVYMLTTTIFRICNRLIRSRNIKNKGWPPEYLDADGDFKDDDEREKK